MASLQSDEEFEQEHFYTERIAQDLREKAQALLEHSRLVRRPAQTLLQAAEQAVERARKLKEEFVSQYDNLSSSDGQGP